MEDKEPSKFLRELDSQPISKLAAESTTLPTQLTYVGREIGYGEVRVERRELGTQGRLRKANRNFDLRGDPE